MVVDRGGQPDDYDTFLSALKQRVREAQTRAALSVNRELVMLYWRLGSAILKQQAERNYGRGVIDRLAADLRREFPERKGFSPRNLWYMRAFAEAYSAERILQQAAAELPW